MEKAEPEKHEKIVECIHHLDLLLDFYEKEDKETWFKICEMINNLDRLRKKTRFVQQIENPLRST